jgi:hypothetical protein
MAGGSDEGSEEEKSQPAEGETFSKTWRSSDGGLSIMLRGQRSRMHRPTGSWIRQQNRPPRDPRGAWPCEWNRPERALTRGNSYSSGLLVRTFGEELGLNLTGKNPLRRRGSKEDTCKKE